VSSRKKEFLFDTSKKNVVIERNSYCSRIDTSPTSHKVKTDNIFL